MSHPYSSAPVESLTEYRGYQGLPPLVGLLTMEEAATKSLTVAQAVDRMKRLNWSLRRLHGIFTSRLSSMPIYEIKMAFSLHAHYCAEHVETISRRLREMRQPPYGLDQSPHAALDVLFDEILAAPNESALLLGLYEVAIPRVVSALKQLQADVNTLFEHPTYRVVRFALIEMDEIQRYGAQAVEVLVSQQERAAHQAWLSALDDILTCAGGLDGAAARSDGSPDRIYSKTPYVYDPVPPPRRTLHRFIQHGRQCGGDALRSEHPAAAEDADALLQAYARDRRA